VGFLPGRVEPERSARDSSRLGARPRKNIRGERDAVQIDLGLLPVWKGVQDKPGFTTLPIRLSVQRGLIRLALSQTELAQITEEYGKEEYNFITAPPGLSSWANRRGDLFFGHLKGCVGSLSGKTVLEIGSGTLYIAERVVNELGASRFVACDPALRSESGLAGVEVVREYYAPGLLAGDSFDLVISLSNLEHIPDPFEYLAEARHLLDPKRGVLYLVVPDCTRGLQGGDLGICLHEHLSYFTRETLCGALAACGFSADWIHVEEDTLFVLARPAARQTGLLAAPANARDTSAGLLEQFKARLRTNLDGAARLVAECKQLGPVALHGCSVGLNNLLYTLGITSDPDLFLFDGDDSKTNKYLPVFQAPIHAASEKLYQTMKNAIVVALTYYGNIVSYLIGTHGFEPNRIYPIFPLEQAPLTV
jgi:SAM-dependent methyltransferase